MRYLSSMAAAAILSLAFSVSLRAEPAKTLPDFKLKLLDGKTVSAGDLKGRVTVMDFWAVWCKPCVAEIPDHNSFYRDYRGRGVRFLAVASDSGSEEDVREAVRRFKIEYPVAAPSLEQLDSIGDILVYPTTWVVDARGHIVKEFLGAPPDKHRAMRSLVDQLLNNTQKR